MRLGVITVMERPSIVHHEETVGEIEEDGCILALERKMATSSHSRGRCLHPRTRWARREALDVEVQGLGRGQG